MYDKVEEEGERGKTRDSSVLVAATYERAQII